MRPQTSGLIVLLSDVVLAAFLKVACDVYLFKLWLVYGLARFLFLVHLSRGRSLLQRILVRKRTVYELACLRVGAPRHVYLSKVWTVYELACFLDVVLFVAQVVLYSNVYLSEGAVCGVACPPCWCIATSTLTSARTTDHGTGRFRRRLGAAGRVWADGPPLAMSPGPAAHT